MALAILFRGQDGAPLAFDACQGLAVEWRLPAGIAPAPFGAAPTGRQAGGGGLAAAGAASGLAHCETRCGAGGAHTGADYSCAIVRLRATSRGAASLELRAAPACGRAAVAYSAPLFAYTTPADPMLKMCAAASSKPGAAQAQPTPYEEVMLHHLPAAFVSAATGPDESRRPRIQTKLGEGSLAVLFRPWSPSSATEPPSPASARHSLRLALRCSLPHADVVTLSHGTAFSFSLSVECAAGLSLADHSCPHDAHRSREAAGKCPVALDFGARGSFRVAGLWPGANLSAEAFLTGAESADTAGVLAPLSELVARRGPNACQDASHASMDVSMDTSTNASRAACFAGQWEVGMTGARLGQARVVVSVPGHASCLPLAVRARVRHAPFRATCPSAQLVVGASMRCHALPLAAARAVAQDPQRTAAVLADTSFAWRLDDHTGELNTLQGGVLRIEADPFAPPGAADAASSPFASVVVTAVSAGTSELRLKATAGPDSFTDSFTVRATPESHTQDCKSLYSKVPHSQARIPSFTVRATPESREGLRISIPQSSPFASPYSTYSSAVATQTGLS